MLHQTNQNAIIWHVINCLISCLASSEYYGICRQGEIHSSFWGASPLLVGRYFLNKFLKDIRAKKNVWRQEVKRIASDLLAGII